MRKLLIVLFISLLCLADAKSKKKKPSSTNQHPPYPTKPRNAMFYVEFEGNFTFIDEVLYYLHNFICISFQRQKTRVTGIGINFLRTTTKSDVKLSKDIKKSTDVYLTENDFSDKKKVLYYIGFALGLSPEIKRYDRNSYVTVISSGIRKEYKSYYKKTTRKTKYSTGFDYGTVMLLNPSYGSLKNKRSYKTKLDPYYDKMIGRTKVFSRNDLKKLYYMYCNGTCKALSNKCQNGGYPNIFCYHCECTIPFFDWNCGDFRRNRSPSCKGEREFSSNSTENNFQINISNEACYYKITSPKKKNVAVTIKKVNFSNSSLCKDSRYGLFVNYRSDKGLTPLHICDNAANVKIPPSSSTVYIAFVGDRYEKGNNVLQFSYKDYK
uniref:Astacin domain-containing protein n=1 Tax=Strongyloides papillosus TaxID=174720 RepID=A0A0N5B1Q0_STREA